MIAENSAAPGNLAVLGSTGSIGTQTLDVVRANPDLFRVVALAAASNVERIVEQAREFRPELIALADARAGQQAKELLKGQCRVVVGEQAATQAAALESVHTVVGAMVGFAGLKPVLVALEQDKHVALANKETLVAAGSLIQLALKQSNSVIVPVDSEHSSIYQCLLARKRNEALRRIILTASGGPFLHHTKDQLMRVTPEEAVRHPKWNMGLKNSLDSATLMNKGLEVIEAAVLFGLRGEQIDVLIHPQSLVHGFVEYVDGSLIAVLFDTDMRVPICFALSYLRSEDPESNPGCEGNLRGMPRLDLTSTEPLQFSAADHSRFPALKLCYQALQSGGTMPTVLNAANEVAVEMYLDHQLGFMDISELVARVMERHQAMVPLSLDDVLAADAWARDCASNIKEGYC